MDHEWPIGATAPRLAPGRRVSAAVSRWTILIGGTRTGAIWRTSARYPVAVVWDARADPERCQAMAYVGAEGGGVGYDPACGQPMVGRG